MLQDFPAIIMGKKVPRDQLSDEVEEDYVEGMPSTELARGPKSSKYSSVSKTSRMASREPIVPYSKDSR